MIHRVKLEEGRPDEFVISSRQVGIPGVFATERAAKYAFRFPDKTLWRLQCEANERAGGKGGVITFEDLQRARKKG